MAGVCFLHLWQNFGGEMTRFADRQCYGVRAEYRFFLHFYFVFLFLNSHGGGA